MIRALILLLSILSLYPSESWGQGQPQREVLQPETQEGFFILQNYLEGEENIFSLSQQGNQNMVQALQNRQGQAGDPNVMEVLQVGNTNDAQLNQRGTGLQVRLRQGGNANRYEGDLNGEDITSDVLQLGNRNNLEQQLSGNGMQYELIQRGNNNELIQLEEAPGQAPGYRIEQNGNGMRLYIEQGNIYRPDRN